MAKPKKKKTVLQAKPKKKKSVNSFCVIPKKPKQPKISSSLSDWIRYEKEFIQWQKDNGKSERKCQQVKRIISKIKDRVKKISGRTYKQSTKNKIQEIDLDIF